MEKRIILERRGKKPHQILELNLDNSKAILIEGLTDEYTALESLSMINVGLTSMKGFPKLPELKKLELSDNRISGCLACLQHCPKLNQLNLSGNKIKDFDALEPLKTLEDLTHLDLFNNPLSNDENDFRTKVFKMLPKLKYLDGTDVNDEEDEEEDDEVGYEDNSNHMHSSGGKNGAPAGYVEEGEEEEEGEEDESFDEEEGAEDEKEENEGPGLSALYEDDIDDGDDEDFDEKAEEEVDDSDVEDDDDSEGPSEKKQKLDADEAATAADT